MTGVIDLHTHSGASDGSMTPAEVIIHAKENGLSALALTDHDTTNGIKEAMEEAKKHNIEFIPGIEISADYPREMHILGLYIDHENSELKKICIDLKKFRVERNKEMIDALREQGFDITCDEVQAQTANNSFESVGRIHMALVLHQKGYTKTVKEAFANYLSGGCKAYVSKQKLSPNEVITLIKNAGGYAFLAHPMHSEHDADKLEALIKELIGYGLDGIECYHSDHTPEFCDICVKICEKYGLMISGGSDFHGANKPHVKIGHTDTASVIPYEILDKIKKKVF